MFPWMCFSISRKDMSPTVQAGLYLLHLFGVRLSSATLNFGMHIAVPCLVRFVDVRPDQEFLWP